MAQISRPFQIALLAVVLLAGVWLFALQGHSSSPSSSSSAAPAPAPSRSAEAKPSTPTSTYHGSAPGVAGLTEAIAKAKGAVTTSQQNAKQLAEKSDQASSPSGSPSQTASSQASAAAPTSTTSAPAATTRAPAAPAVRTAPVKPSAPAKPSATVTLARQRLVEAKLKSGDVVLLLFWDHKGADDVAVQRAVRSLAHSEAKLAVYQALAREVASFGSITRGVQVYGTPTLLIVGRQGHTTVITGLTDAYSIRQAIGDARSS